MKSIWIVALLLLVHLYCGNAAFRRRHGPPPMTKLNKRAVIPDWGSINQRVDNFNATDLRKWEMRYLNNSQFFQEGGPLFIYLGGEWTIQPDFIMGGQIFDMAEEHNGYLFYTEHRYYGESYPTEDIATENLRYLSIDQSLADVAYFIEYQKKTVPAFRNSQVVVIGGSYSATMATWGRMKYPHLIDMVYASSGPVHAIMDYYGFYEAVGENIGLVWPQCLDTITESFVQLERILETEEGIDYISETFNTCSRIRNEDPYRAYFYYMGLTQMFAELVLYATENLIETYCYVLLSFPGETALEKYTSFVRMYYGDVCIDDYDDFLETYTSPARTTDYYRQWIYQMCTEFGFFQTSTSRKQPFGDNFGLEFFVNVCADLFGIEYNEIVLVTGIKRTNIFHGSFNPEITKVISVHGTVDPWVRLGIIRDLNPLAPAILINGTSHCADLSSVTEDDVPQLREAKIRIKQIIAEWLQ